MAIDVRVSRELPFPRAHVAAFCSDPDNDTAWYVNIREVEWLTDKPARVGTRVARVAHFLGRRMAYTYVVDAWEPGVSLDMRAEDGPFPMTTRYTWEDAGDGRCVMTIQLGGGPGGFFGLATPLLEIQLRRQIAADLANLEATLAG